LQGSRSRNRRSQRQLLTTSQPRMGDGSCASSTGLRHKQTS
jgi:hypothetical protein